MPSTKKSAVTLVREVLEDEINSGVRQPGEPLDENELMERFGVSRTPVRTAVLQLSMQGLITILPRSGTYVARMSARELLAMLEVLAELEAACARLATRRFSPADRRKLKALHEEALPAAQREDHEAYERYNAQWHGMLYAGCLNPYLRDQILTIRRRSKVYRRSVFEEPSRIRISYADHGRVTDAVMAGDPEAAGRAMLEHIAGSTQDFLEVLARIPGLEDGLVRRKPAAAMHGAS
ncbi:GntR family transcriptional regulator [Ramlibacter sp.]|uniref:GntR family transcriptional regulator n=1 Tax=Ramlibacter sp. TaxID=1917967 RepID=UPI003D125DDC